MGSEINVFVHLAYHYGARNWNKKYNEDKIPGIVEPLAYGYYRAAEYGCRVVYSEDKIENGIENIFRLCIRFLLGFDFIHAWRNRKGILSADVVWTHTESQHLAIALLFWLTHLKDKPCLGARPLWLIDRWSKYTEAHRWLYRKLLSYADVLTFPSPDQLRVARDLFPEIPSELVLYGINADEIAPLEMRAVHNPLRLLSLGNDEHRDWPTLIDAVKSMDACELVICSEKVSPNLIAGTKFIKVVSVKSRRDVLDLYSWADLVVVTLQPNLHASGITVLQEAALRCVPTICSDAGGLKAYFSDDEVKYVRSRDPEALKNAIRELGKNDRERWEMSKRAQARMGPNGLSSLSFARKNAELSKALLSNPTRPC